MRWMKAIKAITDSYLQISQKDQILVFYIVKSEKRDAHSINSYLKLYVLTETIRFFIKQEELEGSNVTPADRKHIIYIVPPSDAIPIKHVIHKNVFILKIIHIYAHGNDGVMLEPIAMTFSCK